MSKKNLASKVLSVVLTSAMAVSMLAGCGSSAGSTASSAAPAASEAASGSEAASTAAATDTASSGDKVQISIYRDSFNVANPDTKEVQAVQDAINAYIGDKINVEVKLTDIGSGEYKD